MCFPRLLPVTHPGDVRKYPGNDALVVGVGTAVGPAGRKEGRKDGRKEERKA
jgi:hypothetical protein